MKKLYFFTAYLLMAACSKTTLIQPTADIGSTIISTTNYTDGYNGSMDIQFISSENLVSFSQSLLEERDTLQITYITKTQNFDSLVWVFQGAEPLVETANSSYTVSTTHYLGNEIEEQSVYGGIKSTIPYSITIPYRVFGKYDVFHGASNRLAVESKIENDYVQISYKDDRQNWESWESSGIVGWKFPPAGDGDFSICLESLVAFYTNSEVVRIKKPFTGFGGNRKKLIFEFKYDFQIFPSQDKGSRKLGLSMFPSETIPTGLTSEDIPNLWEDGDINRTEFRQVVVELPQVDSFSLVFTKYLGDTDEEGTPIYPFTACIRNMRIIPGD
jgi:hypothetical protein